MAQIFHRSFNVISRVSIFGALFFLVLAGFVTAQVINSPHYTDANIPVSQPVPFSHEAHVGVRKIDCRYCHTSVEESPFAGMPATKTCMNCHSEIWVGSTMLEPVRESYRSGKSIEWQRVHKLPDFVKFDHSIHVNKGVGCVSCHGRVDKMPLTWQVESLHMQWCLECHKQPQERIQPKDTVFNLGWEKPADFDGRKYAEDYHVQSKTSCSVCHR